jgi:hypothetical protein
MRTTIVIEDQLFKLAKRRAAERDVTLGDVVNEALREVLSRPAPTRRQRFQMITFGAEQAPVHHEPADFAAALAAEDEGAQRR